MVVNSTRIAQCCQGCPYNIAGYGNLTPKTDVGKLATMVYALVGIPLMLLYMSNIGSILGDSFKYVYAKVCRYVSKIISCFCIPR